MQDRAALTEEIERIRRGEALGRSAGVRRLFDYLAEASLAGRAPKESEVAIEAFGRPAGYDPTRDAVARVYAHKLRRKLEGTGLAVPLGEYRLMLRATPEPIAADEPPARRRAWPRIAAALVAVAVVASGATWAALGRPPLPPTGDAAGTPVWSQLLSNGRPTVIVVGDYYIFGEIGARGSPDRLVREYTVNSRADLDRFVMRYPEKGATYTDLGLSYLPVGSAQAVARVAPLFSRDKRLRVVTASQLTPTMLKESNLVYVGYLSGLGMLRSPALAGSRFKVGETYDELIDGRTGRHYESQGGGVVTEGEMYRDYGYFATFAGPKGNRIVIIAGTRDAALMQVAETATSAPALNPAIRAAGGARAMEALYVIDGIDRLNFASRLVTSSPLDQAAIWRQDPTRSETLPAG